MLSAAQRPTVLLLASASLSVHSRCITPALRYLRFFALGLMLLLLSTPAFATSVNLAWNPSSSAQVTGYKVYYGYASRQYSTHLDVGKSTTAVVSGLNDAKIYFFAATAYDAAGNQSGYSNEVSYDLTKVDSDKDGLKDWDELSFHKTDPNRADTDGDGLNDGIEVNTHRTDPLKADTDGDAISDGQEIAKGSNPLDAGSIPSTDDVVFAVNAGGPQYAAVDGIAYQADGKFSGGSTYTTTATIAGTADDRLYQSERFGNFSYNIPVTNGNYEVTLKFAEVYFSAVGQRVFNVSVEGKTVLSNVDIVAKVGPRTAYDVTIPTSVNDGVLNISFSSVVNNAKVSGIKVEPRELVFAVNAGGSQYNGVDGTPYQADAKFAGGSTYSVTAAIVGTTDPRLYQSERFGNFSYNIPVANGDYEVTLKFAEIFHTTTGKRVFNVSTEGKTVLSNLDIVAKVGPKKAYDVTVPVTVTDGTLNIGFSSVVDFAKVSGFIVVAK
jgi:Malectin domain/Bacterial TSP3 repeat